MSLDALRIALQGLYELTPISMAVQGLIAEIEEVQRCSQVYGGGGQLHQPVRSRLQEDAAWVEKMAREKWEYIEAANAREAAREAAKRAAEEAAREASRLALDRAKQLQEKQKAAPVVKAPTPVPVMLTSPHKKPGPSPEAVALEQARQLREEAELLLVLSVFL